MDMVENLGFTELFLILFMISTGFALGSLTTLNTVQETQNKTTYNLSCPDPVVKVDKGEEIDRDELRTNSGAKNHIQNPETGVSYSRQGHNIEIEADAVSKPEGMSMRPSIFTRNTVLLDKYEHGEIEAGQIIRYRSDNGGYIIHRVRANYIDTEGYILVKGDNTNSSERVEKEQVTHIVQGLLYT